MSTRKIADFLEIGVSKMKLQKDQVKSLDEGYARTHCCTRPGFRVLLGPSSAYPNGA